MIPLEGKRKVEKCKAQVDMKRSNERSRECHLFRPQSNAIEVHLFESFNCLFSIISIDLIPSYQNKSNVICVDIVAVVNVCL